MYTNCKHGICIMILLNVDRMAQLVDCTLLAMRNPNFVSKVSPLNARKLAFLLIHVVVLIFLIL